MAADYATNKFSAVAGATFSTSDLYKGVVIDSSGHAVLTNTTDTANLVVGSLYSITSTTDAAGSQPVTIAHGPVVKVRLAGSTRAAGQTIGFSTDGMGIAPTTDSGTFGVILEGSSGSTGRIVSVIRTAD